MMQTNADKYGALGKAVALVQLAIKGMDSLSAPVGIPDMLASDPNAGPYHDMNKADEGNDRERIYIAAPLADALASLQAAMGMPSLVEVAPPAPPAVPSAP